MVEQISQRQLRNDSGRIMRGLDDGHTYIVTRHSEPIGELRPLRRRRLVNAAEAVRAFRGAPEVAAARFRDDVDSTIDQNVDARA